MRPAPGLVASLREAISGAAATTSRGGASKLVRPAVKVHPPVAPRRHLPAGARHASTSTPTAAWRAAFESIYAGTFKVIRSSAVVRKGPYTGSKVTPRPAATSPFSTFARASIRQAPRAHFGPRPRPVSVSGTSHAGLGAARQFSSSGYAVLDNVVANAPLALRALADEGLDQRKWKRVKREVTKRERASRKVAVKTVDSRVLAAEKRAEFERFFGSAATVGAPVIDDAFSDESVGAAAAPIEPVTLVLAVDPDFELPLAPASASGATSCGTFLPDSVPERLLSRHALASFETITNAYASHAHRLRAIVNRLSAAGLLDPEVGATSSVGTIRLGDGLDFDQVGRRVWKVVFEDSLVTRSRIEQVVRGIEAESSDDAGAPVPRWARKVRSWTGRNSVAAGEGDWWWLLGGETPAPDSLCVTPESASYSPSYSPSEVNDLASVDDEAARLVASAFVLPDPPSLGFDFDLAPAPEAPSSVASDDTGPRDVWSASLDASGSASISRSSSPLDPAASVWADAEEIVSHTTVETESLLCEDEERSGIERFLEEVEDLRDRRAMRFL